MLLEDVRTNHIEKVPSKMTYKNASFWFNTPNNNAVLSEYQLQGIKEVRMHNYSNKNEYNIDGWIINEEDIIGSDGGFYIGHYSEIAYLQLRVTYRCNDFTIIRYRSADKDADIGDWNSDIKFIVFHTAEQKDKAVRNVNFRNLIELANDIEFHRNYFRTNFDIIDEEEIIEEIDELEEID